MVAIERTCAFTLRRKAIGEWSQIEKKTDHSICKSSQLEVESCQSGSCEETEIILVI